MASNNFIIKCKTEKGTYTLNNLNEDSSVQDLKVSLLKTMSMDTKSIADPKEMKVLCGYPPKALSKESDDLTLSKVNIISGDTLIIETSKQSSSCAVKSSEEVKKTISPVAEMCYDEFPPAETGIMMRHVVPSNNSCLFTSVYFILTNGEVDHEKSNELRKIISDTVSANPVKYNFAYLGMSNGEYCAWIENTEHWGGAIELAILSEHFRVEIVAVDTLSLTMHHFGESSNFSNRIFLIYDGIHYDPLVLELNNTTQTVFPTSDPVPLEMALEIAKEAKSSRQFTDIANFKLLCRECNKRLQGDNEAREHAKVTGHVSFGEITL